MSFPAVFLFKRDIDVKICSGDIFLQILVAITLGKLKLIFTIVNVF